MSRYITHHSEAFFHIFDRKILSAKVSIGAVIKKFAFNILWVHIEVLKKKVLIKKIAKMKFAKNKL